jgi:uncharacterized protein YdhG (YjbR/CyaY superfamily)
MRGRPTPRTHSEYFAAQPRAVAARLRQIHSAVRKGVPDAVEVISYGMPAFKLHGRILIYYAAHSNHVGLYPAPRTAPEFKEELASYGGGKGTVQFPHAERFPAGLVGRMVRFKAKELREKYGSSARTARPPKKAKPKRAARKTKSK